MEYRCEYHSAAYHLGEAAREFAMLHAVMIAAPDSSYLTATYKERAETALFHATQALGFRLVPLTEQKEAA